MKCGFGLILMLIMANANASVITVGPTGCEYSSIQAAVDAAASGDIIQVQSGAYYEKVDVNKQLTLQGINTGIGKPVVDAEFSGSSFTLNEDGIILEGFAATNSENLSISTCAAGVYVYSNHNIIRNNDFVNNVFGIRLVQSRDNVMISNKVSNNGFGIDLDSSINNTITQNIIEGNYQCGSLKIPNLGNGQTCSLGDGIRLKYSSGNNITYNEIKNNCEGITLESSHLNTITHNEMAYNLGNIDSKYSSNNIITPNRIIEYRAFKGSGIDFCEAGDTRRSGYKEP
jgi:parallel beta-helix repeat protein